MKAEIAVHGRWHPGTKKMYGFFQCAGYGSGSSDPNLWLTEPDLDPALFVTDLQDAINWWFFFSRLLCLPVFLFEGTFISFFKEKKIIKRHKTVEIKDFLHFFLVDGRIRIHPTKLRIWIQKAKNIQISIRNTGFFFFCSSAKIQTH